jgi:hypothetical protein
MLISAVTAIIVFVIIVIIAALVTYFIGHGQLYDQSYTKTFISVLMCSIAVVLLIYYYNVITLQNKHDCEHAAGELQKVYEIVMKDIPEAIAGANETIPYFVSTLYPLQVSVTHRPPLDPDRYDTRLRYTFLSERIFYGWQALANLSVENSNADAMLPLLTLCVQHGHSSLLLEQWKTLKEQYSMSGQKLGNLIFHHAARVTPDTAVPCHILANEVWKDFYNTTDSGQG